jgi:hypothetical protein
MLKTGDFVVTKGKNNPWIYRVKSIDKMLNVAYCQYVGHDGKSRICLDKQACNDKWKSMSEMREASFSEIYSALKVTDNEPANTVIARVRGLASILDGKKKKVAICSHSWQNYIGFSKSYKFCTKCDTKRDLSDG